MLWKQLGVSVRSEFENGYLPVIVNANGINGGKTKLDASRSSQFLTSLMLVAPYAKDGMEIEVIGNLKTPYIDITMAVMEAFGVRVINTGYKLFSISDGQQYQSRVYHIETGCLQCVLFFWVPLRSRVDVSL